MIRNSAIAEKWAQRISNCLGSGMSIKKWCNQQGLKDSTYRYWVKKLKTFHNQDKVA
jgi:transposase-like protein